MFVWVGGEGEEDSAAEVMTGHCGCRYGRMLTTKRSGTLAFTWPCKTGQQQGWETPLSFALWKSAYCTKPVWLTDASVVMVGVLESARHSLPNIYSLCVSHKLFHKMLVKTAFVSDCLLPWTPHLWLKLSWVSKEPFSKDSKKTG